MERKLMIAGAGVALLLCLMMKFFPEPQVGRYTVHKDGHEVIMTDTVTGASKICTVLHKTADFIETIGPHCTDLVPSYQEISAKK